MSRTFVHLHLHTEYSLADSVIRIEPLMQAVRDAGMPAVALTDRSNMFAAVKFHSAAVAAGVQPIIGVDLLVAEPDDEENPSRIVLLAQDARGYLNLTRLVSRSFTEGQHRGSPRIQRAWLDGHGDGMIALSGGRHGDVGRALLAGREDAAKSALDCWRSLFGDRYYLEVVRTGREYEEDCLHATVGFAARNGTPVTASNDVCFLRIDDFEAHEARVCIHGGYTLDDPNRPRAHSSEQYLRDPAEMEALFSDLPEALDNAVEIARRCSFRMRLGGNHLPQFPVPGGQAPEAHLRELTAAGLDARLSEHPPYAPRGTYDARLAHELGVIQDMGFAGYFLIVADFIRWAKGNGVPVGPGRGSGAGSLVGWALGITDLDPIRYDLLFERFLNPERVSMPDFDIDFCMEGRDRVIEYVTGRYGREQVSQIITYGTMAARAVVRDVGRVLGYGYGHVDRVAKLVPFELGMTLERALDDDDLRREYEQDDDVRTLIDLAMKLEGLARNAGRHAGGVVIAPSPLTDFLPLYCEENGGSHVAQFDKQDIERIGLVKFDFLGLRTLTIIDWTVRTVNARRGEGEPALDIGKLPLDDAATFDLLKRCMTTAVFQLESRGMKELVKRLQPDNFEEIVALVALFRPGPLQSGMVEDFIARKHGHGRVEYPHPDLEPILRTTYGVILYQEQVMQIAQVLAGYKLGEADLLRRAMGKKKPEEMALQRNVFTDGAVARGVPASLATHIFDLMEKFAGYGFNRSHSAAYAMLSYQTAWLKAHHTAAFMAAVLSADMDNTDKVVTLIDECAQLGLAVLPPDVNASGFRFTAEDDESIRYGLGALRGVGEGAVEAIVGARGAGGPFVDLAEFCRRMDPHRVNKRVIESLLKAGALDGLGGGRAMMSQQLAQALRLAEQQVHAEVTGQDDLFGLGDGTDGTAARALVVPDKAVVEWSESERLLNEKETLGLYLTGHPIQRYEQELAQFTSGRIAALIEQAGDGGGGQRRDASSRRVTLAGLVSDVRKRGNGRLTVTLDDRSARIELPLFDEAVDKYRHLIERERLLVVEGKVGYDEYIGGHRVSQDRKKDRIYDICRARETHARRIEVDFHAGEHDAAFVTALKETLTPYVRGGCQVWVNYRGSEAMVPVNLGAEWRVRPEDELLGALAGIAGAGRVRVVYDTGHIEWNP